MVCAFFITCPRVATLTASQTDCRRVPLCVHDYRAFRTVQAALQITTVVSSDDLVSRGNGGNSML